MARPCQAYLAAAVKAAPSSNIETPVPRTAPSTVRSHFFTPMSHAGSPGPAPAAVAPPPVPSNSAGTRDYDPKLDRESLGNLMAMMGKAQDEKNRVLEEQNSMLHEQMRRLRAGEDDLTGYDAEMASWQL